MAVKVTLAKMAHLSAAAGCVFTLLDMGAHDRMFAAAAPEAALPGQVV